MKANLTLALGLALATPAHAEKMFCKAADMQTVIETFAKKGFSVVADGTLMGNIDHPMTMIENKNGVWFLMFESQPKITCFFAAGHQLHVATAPSPSSY